MKRSNFPSLRVYLRSLEMPEKLLFAKKCGTSIGYLRKVLSCSVKIEVGLLENLVIHSGGSVCAHELRPDVNWGHLSRTVLRQLNPRNTEKRQEQEQQAA
jgi:DNA-binding transcriptional regulator YdaS (Cro superfamily)